MAGSQDINQRDCQYFGEFGAKMGMLMFMSLCLLMFNGCFSSKPIFAYNLSLINIFLIVKDQRLLQVTMLQLICVLNDMQLG